MSGRDLEPLRRAPRSTLPAEPSEAGRSAQSAVEALASAAGNRAVARLLQRQPDGPSVTSLQFTRPPAATTPNLNVDPDFVRRRQEEVEERVRQHLRTQREVLLADIAKGMPMPEIVDLVRRTVPDATQLAPEQIERIVQACFQGVHILPHRITADGSLADSELAALVRNVMGIKTELALERPHGWVKVSISGYEVGLRKGDLEASGSVGWDKSFGAKGRVGPIHFGATLEPPEQPGGDIRWEAELAFPEEGAMVPMMARLPQVMGAADGAIGSLAGQAVQHGLPAPGEIAKAFVPVKEAVDGLSAIAKAKRPAFGVKVEGDGPAITVQATLTVPF